MKKDYLEEAWKELEFKYDDPYYRSLRQGIWLCLRVLELQCVYDPTFAELAHEEFLRLRYRVLEYEYYKRKKALHFLKHCAILYSESYLNFTKETDEDYEDKGI